MRQAFKSVDLGMAFGSGDQLGKRSELGPQGDIAPNGSGLRVALLSGNYNCIRDGANKALNLLVAHLLKRGAAVRVYSPVCPTPAFPPAGDLVSVPSLPIPGRPEYRFALGMPRSVRDDIVGFAPNLFHLSVPDVLNHRALDLARQLGVPVVASMHTRFETYVEYYRLGFLRPFLEHVQKDFYRDCDLVFAPNRFLAAELRRDIPGIRTAIWGRGVDCRLFSPARRDLAWRRRNGFGDEEMIALFFGRLVLEKGTRLFAQTINELRSRGHSIVPLVVGDGPARQSLADEVGDAVFAGYLEGDDLGCAVASADILVNPSRTEAFGNVNLEAMAAGLAIVSADVESARALITHGRTGLLVSEADVDAYADAVERLLRDRALARRLGEAARLAAAGHEWPGILDGVIDDYRAVTMSRATVYQGVESTAAEQFIQGMHDAA